MTTKSILSQYIDIKDEIREVRAKIDRLEADIQRIEDGEKVVDSVTGGFGGTQHFRIEGIPYPEYSRKKTLLYSRKTTLQLLEDDLLTKTNEVEQFIASIPDSRMRRIINLRYLENMSWNKVADHIGGGNTEDSVRKACERFLKSN